MPIRIRIFRLKRILTILTIICLFLLGYLLWTYNETFDNVEVIMKTDSEERIQTELKEVKEKIRIPDRFIRKPAVSPSSNLRESIFGKTKDHQDLDKMEAVKELFMHAWKGYRSHAWGSNEINVLLGEPHTNTIFGNKNLGATIIDALDTLILMEMPEEIAAAKDWIMKNLDFSTSTQVSLFELNIRFLGGLLSAYSLTEDEVYLKKAREFADSVLLAFNSPTGLPFSLINLSSKSVNTHSWVPSSCVILSEFGSLHLEWVFLTELTKNQIYADKVIKIRNLTASTLAREKGMFNNYYSPNTGSVCSRSISLGSMGDSFYEYLLKEYKRTGGKDKEAKQLYDSAMQGMMDLGMLRLSPENNYYLASYNGQASDNMEHLACFAGGMLAYGAKDRSDPLFEKGAAITQTCRLSYDKSQWKLGPDRFEFKSNIEAVAAASGDSRYLQRPEVFESYFYMWRLTHDQKYRDWAWEAVLALNRTRLNYGFAGVTNVYDAQSSLDNVQQSYFLAETLKYLYLIFCSDDVLSFDRWVFNTEAHPFPIHDKVPLTRWKFSSAAVEL